MSMNHFENIVLLRKNDARKALDILARDGRLAAVEHLKRWHRPGEATVVSTRETPWESGDATFEHKGYVIYYNADIPYIGLVCRIQITPPADSA